MKVLSPGSGVVHVCAEITRNKHHPICLRDPRQLCSYRKLSQAPFSSLLPDFTDTRAAQLLQACMDHSHQNSTGGCTHHWQWEPLESAALHWTGLLSVKYHLKHHYQQFSSSLVLAWQNPPELLRCESATHVHTDVTEPCPRQWGSRVRNLFSWDVICPPHTLEGICKSMRPEAKLLSP